MNTSSRTISTIQANQQVARQEADGNLIIKKIDIKNGVIIAENGACDLTLSEMTVRDYVIREFFKYNSVNHYYGAEHDLEPEKFYKGIETLELIARKVKEIEEVLSRCNVAILLNATVRGKKSSHIIPASELNSFLKK